MDRGEQVGSNPDHWDGMLPELLQVVLSSKLGFSTSLSTYVYSYIAMKPMSKLRSTTVYT